MDISQNIAFVLFSAVSPLLIAIIKQQGWSTQVNALVAFIGYIVVGVAGVLVSGEALTIENAVPLVTLATVIGTAAYNLLWQNLGDNGSGVSLEDRITAATSFVKASA